MARYAVGSFQAPTSSIKNHVEVLVEKVYTCINEVTSCGTPRYLIWASTRIVMWRSISYVLLATKISMPQEYRIEKSLYPKVQQYLGPNRNFPQQCFYLPTDVLGLDLLPPYIQQVIMHLKL